MTTSTRRGYTRHPISLVVEVRAAEGWVAAETVDISRTGLQLQTPPGLDTSPILQLRIHLEPAPLVVLARVTRRVGGVLSPGEIPGIGVELMSMQPDHRRRWDEFVIETSRASSAMATVTAAPRAVQRSSVAGGDDVLAGAPGRRPSTQDEAVPRRPSRPLGSPDPGRGDRSLYGSNRLRSQPQPEAAPIRQDAPFATFSAPTTPEPTPRSSLGASRSAAPAAVAETVLRVRPASSSRLQALVDRRLQSCDLFLRPDIELREGEKVALVLVHHATDGELAMSCVVDRVLPGRPGGRPGILLRFGQAAPADAKAMLAFVADGVPPAKLPSEAALARTDAAIETLRAATVERPEDARRWLRLGWALLLAGRPAEATGPLQRGVTLAPMLPVGPLMLVLAHGLAGDHESARTVLGGMDATELLESLLD